MCVCVTYCCFSYLYSCLQHCNEYNPLCVSYSIIICFINSPILPTTEWHKHPILQTLVGLSIVIKHLYLNIKLFCVFSTVLKRNKFNSNCTLCAHKNQSHQLVLGLPTNTKEIVNLSFILYQQIIMCVCVCVWILHCMFNTNEIRGDFKLEN